MRQAGVLAAAARVALRDWERLAEDHALARHLAEVLEERLPGAVMAPPQTNMVQVAGERLPGGPEPFREALAAAGVRVGYIRPGVLRFVTHRDVDGGRRGPRRRRGRSPGPVTAGACRAAGRSYALLFPGQGSQAVGMGADVFAARPGPGRRRRPGSPGLGPGAPVPRGPRGGH